MNTLKMVKLKAGEKKSLNKCTTLLASLKFQKFKILQKCSRASIFESHLLSGEDDDDNDDDDDDDDDDVDVDDDAEIRSMLATLEIQFSKVSEN